MRSKVEVEIFMRHALNELELKRIVYLDLGKDEIKWALEFLDTVKGVSWASGHVPSHNTHYWEDNIKRFLVINRGMTIFSTNRALPLHACQNLFQVG